MNSEQLAALLTDTLVSVFEETVFALMERESETIDDGTLVVESLVTFCGTYTGTLALEVEAAGVAQLASDLLGAEDSKAASAQRSDVIGELANITAGRLLEAWQPSATDYDIGIPAVQIQAHGQTRLATEPQVCSVRLRTDTGLHVAAAILLAAWT